MDFSSFLQSLNNHQPTEDFSAELQALWWIRKDQWNIAHDMVQNLSSKNAALIHALLHKIEGDIWNANYWYANANSNNPNISIEKEWENLVKKIL
ncbi:hypothetical protein E0W69_018615 [Rhizosphaericola mali]|uniref:Uncharacterized protein n=2 Tax=Rhizosphaericola mali TaxID=2545455 RepID=A0A5P2G5B6_9BACT|nr:hypothetical protein E0W69_018615 [Rhizosphaericola mali]